jgi:hypothetical protein
MPADRSPALPGSPDARYADAPYVMTLDQVDELERLRRRIQLRTVLIDYTFLQDEHLKLEDAFTGEGTGEYTVAEAIAELLDDIREAAHGIEKIMAAVNAARLERLALES